jgi:hypothetical protein
LLGHSLVVDEIRVVGKPMGMSGTQHFHLLVADVDPGISQNFFGSWPFLGIFLENFIQKLSCAR